MKLLINLLICTSLVLAKPTDDFKKNLSSNKNVLINYHGICDYCNFYFEFQFTMFQNKKFVKFIFEKAEQECPDEQCIDRIKSFVVSMLTEQDAKHACKTVCNEQKKDILFSFPVVINESSKCNTCYQYFDVLHEAFQDPLIRIINLATFKAFCEGEDCETGEKLFETITRETDVKKGCEPVCKKTNFFFKLL